MTRVVLWGSLKSATDGETELDLDVRNVRELLNALGEHYPDLQPQLRRGVSISIDGRIYNDDWFKPIEPDSEVFVLPRITGG